MKIELFKDVTTEDILLELEEKAKTYDGLYCDMENKDERKFVKDNAALITGLLKKLDRKRIDETKAAKVAIDAEYNLIKPRLEAANAAFSLLIDEHKAERKKILDAEKAKKQAVDDSIQLELDHENGLMMNKLYAVEKAEAVAAKERHEQLIADNAAKQAVINESNRIKAAEAEQKRVDDLRAADTEHRKMVNISAKQALIAQAGLSDKHAENVIIAIARNLIPAVSIKY